MPSYRFQTVLRCTMCLTDTQSARVLGMRLNRSQQRHPQCLTGAAVTVCRCSRCGLVFANPMPVPASFDDHYDRAASDYWPSEYFRDEPDYFSAQLKTLSQLTTGRGVALDIGAGLGKGMKALERFGFKVYGLEPAPQFHRLAIDRMGIAEDRLQQAAVESAAYPDASFDFITFGAVLEHLQQPGEAITRAVGWLKPGGLMHLEVPNAGWLVARLINSFYRLQGTRFVTNLSPMHPPFHLYEFTARSFEELAQRLGLKLLQTKIEVCEIFHLPSIMHPLLRLAMSLSKTGMQMTIWVQKPDFPSGD